MKNVKLVVWISSILLLSSCKLAYLPSPIYTPQLQSKGEMNVAVNAGNAGLGFDFAHAVTNHFGYTVGISGISPFDINSLFNSEYNFDSNSTMQDNTTDDTQIGENRINIALAPGYFAKINENCRWELFGGIGYCYDEIGTPDLEGGLYDTESNSFLRYFIQADISFAFRNFDIILANRITQVEYLTGKTEIKMNPGTFTEPALTLKFGGNTKFYVQGGYSIPLNPDQFNFGYKPLILSLGVQVPILRE